MKILSIPTYEVDEALHARLSEKYSSFMPEFTEFKVGPAKVRLDKRMTDGLAGKPRQRDKLNLSVLWVELLKLCLRLGIPSLFLHTAVVLEEDVNEAMHLVFQDDKDGAPWGYIFIPPSLIQSPVAHFLFVLLHELCHCLLNVPFPKDAKEIYDYEFLVDVLSIAALREVVPTHARQCREAIRSLSYIAADEMKERLGPKMQREILRDPEAFLRKMVEPAQRLPNQEDQTAPVKKEV